MIEQPPLPGSVVDDETRRAVRLSLLLGLATASEALDIYREAAAAALVLRNMLIRRARAAEVTVADIAAHAGVHPDSIYHLPDPPDSSA